MRGTNQRGGQAGLHPANVESGENLLRFTRRNLARGYSAQMELKVARGCLNFHCFCLSRRYLFILLLNTVTNFYLQCFLKILFLLRERGRREKERRRKRGRETLMCKRNTNHLPFAYPQPGTRPTAQECTLTRNRTSNLFISQADTKSTEPLQPGLQLFFKMTNSRSTEVTALAFSYGTLLHLDSCLKNTEPGMGPQQLAGLLQEGSGASHTCLVYGLKVGLILLIGAFNNNLVLWTTVPK